MSLLAPGGAAGTSQSAWNNPQILSALLPNYNISALDNAMQAELTAAATPLSDLSAQLSSIQTQVSAWQTLQGDLNSVLTDAQSLAGQTLYQGVSATSSDPAAVGASGSGTGAPGTYQVAVTQLMQPEIDNSAAQSSASSALGYSGSFTINGATVQVGSGDSLQTIADSINAASAGVTATVLPSGGKYVLNLASTEGSAISWTDPSNILQGLGVLNSALAPANQVQAAKPTLYTVNGVSEQSPTDGDSTSIPGVTLTFSGTTGATPATVTVAQNQQAIVAQFQQLAGDVNHLLSDIQTYAGQGGVLEGNATVLGISDSLQQALGSFNPSQPGGDQSLSQIGVTLSAPVGSPSQLTMSVDTTSLQKALGGNAAAVALLMNGATTGIAQQLVTELNSLVGTTGSITGQISNLQSQESSVSSQVNDPNSAINMEVNAEQQALQTQFQNMLQALLTSQTQGDQIQGFLNQQYAAASGKSGG